MKTFVTLLASVGLVAAHGYVDSATIGGKDYQVCPNGKLSNAWPRLT